MIYRYFDPSAWVKRYFQERGSDNVIALFRDPSVVACCRLGLLEIVATIVRKSHGASFDESTVKGILKNVTDDFENFHVVAVDSHCIDLATELAIRHRLRTMDAVHLASALSLRNLGDIELISSDRELLDAATREGLATLDPAQIIPPSSTMLNP